MARERAAEVASGESSPRVQRMMHQPAGPEERGRDPVDSGRALNMHQVPRRNCELRTVGPAEAVAADAPAEVLADLLELAADGALLGDAAFLGLGRVVSE